MKYLNNKLMSITTVALLCTASSSMAHPGHELDSIVAAEQLSNAFEKVATTLSPSVVTIRSTKEVEVRRWNYRPCRCNRRHVRRSENRIWRKCQPTPWKRDHIESNSRRYSHLQR